MMPTKLAAVAGVAVAACVSPVDYTEPVIMDAPSAPLCTDDVDDEDHDCVANKPDVCPTVRDPDQLDTDGDKVGEACDPHPLKEGDQIVLFVPFAPDEAPWPWQGTDWNIHAGALEVDTLEVEGSAYHTSVLPQRLLIVADIRIDFQGPDATVSLFSEYSTEHGGRSECFVRRGLFNRPAVVGWSRDSGSGPDDTITTDVPGPVLEQGQRFRLIAEQGYRDLDGAPAGTRCSYVTDGGEITTVTFDGNRPSTGHLGFAARGARLEVESVIVYTTVF